jgi:hypothetical protein
MKRYLGMTEEELVENTKLWEEEQGTGEGDEASTEGDLRAAGVTPGGIEGDIDTFDELEGSMEDMEGGEDMGGDLAGPDASAEAPLDI